MQIDAQYIATEFDTLAQRYALCPVPLFLYGSSETKRNAFVKKLHTYRAGHSTHLHTHRCIKDQLPHLITLLKYPTDHTLQIVDVETLTPTEQYTIVSHLSHKTQPRLIFTSNAPLFSFFTKGIVVPSLFSYLTLLPLELPKDSLFL